MEWQPIETAPKDGTWIALWRGPSEHGTWCPMVFARWHRWDDGDEAWVWPDSMYDPFTEEGREDADIMIDRADYYDDSEHFTHWMPLPEPPK